MSNTPDLGQTGHNLESRRAKPFKIIVPIEGHSAILGTVSLNPFLPAGYRTNPTIYLTYLPWHNHLRNAAVVGSCAVGSTVADRVLLHPEQNKSAVSFPANGAWVFNGQRYQAAFRVPNAR